MSTYDLSKKPVLRPLIEPSQSKNALGSERVTNRVKQGGATRPSACPWVERSPIPRVFSFGAALPIWRVALSCGPLCRGLLRNGGPLLPLRSLGHRARTALPGAGGRQRCVHRRQGPEVDRGRVRRTPRGARHHRRRPRRLTRQIPGKTLGTPRPRDPGDCLLTSGAGRLLRDRHRHVGRSSGPATVDRHESTALPSAAVRGGRSVDQRRAQLGERDQSAPASRSVSASSSVLRLALSGRLALARSRRSPESSRSCTCLDTTDRSGLRAPWSLLGLELDLLTLDELLEAGAIDCRKVDENVHRAVVRSHT
jgi:hypothetical protein